jgi:PAS domain-containing protein
MFSLNPYSLGILSVVAGLALWLMARLLMKTVPRSGGIVPHAIDDQAADAGHGEAVLVVQAGGRVLSVNPALRQLFQLPAEDHPNLEWIARRIRPSEPFLHLCSMKAAVVLLLKAGFAR